MNLQAECCVFGGSAARGILSKVMKVFHMQVYLIWYTSFEEQSKSNLCSRSCHSLIPAKFDHMGDPLLLCHECVSTDVELAVGDDDLG